jgi:hypothetical protein
MRLIVNVLDVTAEPSFPFQVNAKFPQKFPEILFCTWIARMQFLPHNVPVFD